MLRECLLSRAPVPPDHFHPIDTTLSGPGEGARRYDETLGRAFRGSPGGLPRFDAILLGLGADEVQGIVAERGVVEIGCDFCGTQYHFDAVDVGAMFAPAADQAPGSSRVN